MQALMAHIKHVTPQMTISDATLASPILRDAYDQAIGKMRRTDVVGIFPDRTA